MTAMLMAMLMAKRLSKGEMMVSPNLDWLIAPCSIRQQMSMQWKEKRWR